MTDIQKVKVINSDEYITVSNEKERQFYGTIHLYCTIDNPETNWQCCNHPMEIHISTPVKTNELKVSIGHELDICEDCLRLGLHQSKDTPPSIKKVIDSFKAALTEYLSENSLLDVGKDNSNEK